MFLLPIPSGGRALLAFAPTIFSIPLPPAVALSLPSRACCKNSVVTADPLTLSLRFAAMGVTVSRLTLIVKRANDIFCEHATKNS